MRSTAMSASRSSSRWSLRRQEGAQPSPQPRSVDREVVGEQRDREQLEQQADHRGADADGVARHLLAERCDRAVGAAELGDDPAAGQVGAEAVVDQPRRLVGEVRYCLDETAHLSDEQAPHDGDERRDDRQQPEEDQSGRPAPAPAAGGQPVDQRLHRAAEEEGRRAPGSSVRAAGRSGRPRPAPPTTTSITVRVARPSHGGACRGHRTARWRGASLLPRAMAREPWGHVLTLAGRAAPATVARPGVASRSRRTW